MGMFLNYQNIANSYPNNLVNAFPSCDICSKLNPLEASKPYEEYNIKGDLIGYFWRYGETLNLEFNIDGELTIESDAILFKKSGQVPTVRTMAKIGQRAYNIIDLKSWTCTAIEAGNYIWEADTEFTYPVGADRKVYIPAESYLKDKHVEVTLYNFRMEPICKKLYDAAPTIIFGIDKELSKKLVRGIYYCSVTVFNDEVAYKIFDTTDGSLLVK